MKTAEEIRTMFYQRLNHLLKRPGMYVFSDADLEIQIQMLIDDLRFIDEKVKTEKTLREELIDEGFFYPANMAPGVYCIFKSIMPDVNRLSDEICSVYARKAHQLNYLDIENLLPDEKFQSTKERIIDGEFSKGMTTKNILEKLPQPSFKAGLDIFCYAPEDLMGQWIYFDFATKFINHKRIEYLRSIRWPAETFEDGFELTYEGYEVTRRGIAKPECDDEEKPRESRWKHLW